MLNVHTAVPAGLTSTEALPRVPPESQPAPLYRLAAIGPVGTQTLTLERGETVTIGRASPASVLLHDGAVSRVHAVLRLGETVTIEDLGSRNGTLVCGERIAPHCAKTVRPGDTFSIGRTVFVLVGDARRDWTRTLVPYAEWVATVKAGCASARATIAVGRFRVHEGEGEARILDALAGTLEATDHLSGCSPGEFALLLSGQDDADIETRMAAVIEALGDIELDGALGWARPPGDGATALELVRKAEDRVYKAKLEDIPSDVVVVAPAMRRLYQLAAQVARSDLNVLVLGETGSGKDALARMLHRASNRAGRPFLSVNCAALHESLLESELFGHERGAFTGATQMKVGLLEAAPGGTVFLDEVGELPAGVQAKLLRVIENREIRRLGSTTVRPIDVRFVAATNRDLEAAVAAGTFRGDLFFRLSGMSLRVPPLRERRVEVPALAMQFLKDAAARMNRRPPQISAEAIAVLQDHSWPGNVRELRNAVERALVLCSGDEIRAFHFQLRQRVASPLPAPAHGEAPPTALPPASDAPISERRRILEALAATGGNQSRAAQRLGMPRRTFCRRLVEYKIERPRTVREEENDL